MVKLGSAFSDNLVSSNKVRSKQKSDEAPWWAGSGRTLMFATILCIGFFVLLWRLFDLTVVNGREYRRLSDTNRTRSLTRRAPRGLLLDRTGKPLVENIQIISQSGEVDYVRRYLYGEALSHVVGYTGELSGEELKSDYYRTRNYGLGDRVGRMGAEAVYNERLRGRDGKELVEIDSSGTILRTLGRQEELAGEDVSLSLDANLAKTAAQAFPPGQKGAIIVTKPQSGEVLVMYSSPGFSPDAFATGMSQAEYSALISNPDLPMFNRAIGGAYPPGSTFKIVTALAGLEEGAFTKTTTVEDNGVITIGPFTFPNWYFIQYGKTEGAVNVVKALQRSNDIFFYKAGEWIGVTKLAEWARKVGIGKPQGIELSGEAGGLMPDSAWKKTRFDTEADKLARNDEWYLGDTYHIAIGQGYLLTTPLAVNIWTNIIANGGKLCKPTIRKINSLREEREQCKDLRIKKETVNSILEGMQQACATGGTGWPLFNFAVSKATFSPTDSPESSVSAAPKIHVPVACKTGTAEFGDPNNRTHAWFTAFGPITIDSGNQAIKIDQTRITGEPEISVTVLVEGAGEGSTVAAPIAKKIFEEWFSR